ncbi:signal peptide peptidase SppA [Psychrosphaera haliotis]|uniref:signal peptide peptidase SppA n=1 Tax=Psychrosphaera haliotis TaxID=555083 RepID=UPI0012DA4C0D|nr:signal peptide peptidase SppA [Psychrosphaera haliotis]
MSNEISTNKNWFFDLIRACWGVLNFTRKAVLNIIFIFIAIAIFAGLSSSNTEKPIIFAENSILELKLVGDIVEEKAVVDPYAEVMNDALGGADSRKELLLTDILNAIDFAAKDNKISMLKLDVHGLQNAGLSKLQEVGNALQRFKETSGKPIVAYGDFYTQGQYYLAAHADTVILHPMGSIILDGFGRYNTYYKSALDKLEVNSHIFRVGTFKSAIEPYIRDDMSAEAKEANNQWLNELWNMYKTDVASQRKLENTQFDEKLSAFYEKFKSVDGDFSDLALTNNWIDMVMTHQEFNAYLQQEMNSEDVNYITLNKYLDFVDQSYPILAANKVAVVVASGTIYDGNAKPGEIGGHSTAKLLRDARLDDTVKAIVLRVDSPGGSAFASEIIRNEIEAIKESGKPIVTSMSSLAASGGYWIAASTDKIWASPSTITGSIGIFGMFLTYEETLAKLGVYTDGVGTTELAGLSAARKLPKAMEDILQLSVENGYRQFLNLVATERDMSIKEVDNIAQGRVWSGQTAKALGLVDELGFFDDAIKGAAELASLEDYSVITIQEPVLGFDKIIQQFLGMAKVYAPPLAIETTSQRSNPFTSLVNKMWDDATGWMKFNDPKHMYIYCLECEALTQ